MCILYVQLDSCGCIATWMIDDFNARYMIIRTGFEENFMLLFR